MAKVQKVTKVTQSPMNRARWCLDLACGHEVWVSAVARPRAQTKVCLRCAGNIE